MSGPSRILQTIAALQRGERREASTLLAEELRTGPATGPSWAKVSQLLQQVGEIDMAIEASRRASRSEPVTLDRLLAHCGVLASYGRSDEALADLEALPGPVQGQPAVLHFRGTIAAERGEFDAAEDYFRRALAINAGAPQTWFALAMGKTFTPGDPDLAAMERLRPVLHQMDPLTRARFHYAMGKTYDDLGETERAFADYAQGAALRRNDPPYRAEVVEAKADGLIRDFTAESMRRLVPQETDDAPALFINGLPRSGTTLVEQILASHSAVGDGGEINLIRAALIPTVDHSFDGALRYQQRQPDDPWGAVAGDYRRMLAMRFRTDGLIIDKTLNQSTMMGLLLHALPGARVIWMRRRPEDVALSCYRSFFTSPLPWTWSLEDIARHFRIEDRLFAHWTALFPERILVVPYEEMARDPQDWIPRILSHVGLPLEPQVFEPHKTKRGVRTASVRQVRQPIGTNRIGTAERYAAQLKPFTDIYYA